MKDSIWELSVRLLRKKMTRTLCYCVTRPAVQTYAILAHGHLFQNTLVIVNSNFAGGMQRSEPLLGRDILVHNTWDILIHEIWRKYGY